jgi:adenosylhomocysteinase
MRGMGAIALVCEIDPLRALEAAMDGFEVTTVVDAAARAELIVTATGNVNVVGREALETLRDGAILANAGHFNDEIDLGYLTSNASECREVRPFVKEYRVGGRRVVVLADGRLVNLAAAEGHPAAVMDMSFANQALAVEHLVKSAKDLRPQVYPVPREIDERIAAAKLAAMGMRIDEMTEEQRVYAASWKSGTR